jgi:hypothetical protein
MISLNYPTREEIESALSVGAVTITVGNFRKIENLSDGFGDWKSVDQSPRFHGFDGKRNGFVGELPVRRR